MLNCFTNVGKLYGIAIDRLLYPVRNTSGRALSVGMLPGFWLSALVAGSDVVRGMEALQGALAGRRASRPIAPVRARRVGGSA